MTEFPNIAILIAGIIVSLGFALVVAKLIKLKIDKLYRARYQVLADGLDAQWSFDESGNPALCGRLHDLKYHLTIQDIGHKESNNQFTQNRKKRRIIIHFPIQAAGQFCLWDKSRIIDVRDFSLEEPNWIPITTQSLLSDLNWQADNDADLHHYLKNHSHDEVLTKFFNSGIMERFNVKDGHATARLNVYYARGELIPFFLSPPPSTLSEIMPLLEQLRQLL